MFISKKEKILFFHVPKTAGSSVRDYLMKNCKDGSYYSFMLYEQFTKTYKTDALQFKTLNEYNRLNDPFFSHLNQEQSKDLLHAFNLDPTEFTELVVVRNPYDRLLSYYNFTLYKHYKTIHDLLDDAGTCSDKLNMLFFRGQLDYVSNPLSKKQHIFKYEELEKFENFLQEHIKTQDKLPKINVTKYLHIDKLDTDMKERCYKIFKDEFDILRYDK